MHTLKLCTLKAKHTQTLCVCALLAHTQSYLRPRNISAPLYVLTALSRCRNVKYPEPRSPQALVEQDGGETLDLNNSDCSHVTYCNSLYTRVLRQLLNLKGFSRKRYILLL